MFNPVECHRSSGNPERFKVITNKYGAMTAEPVIVDAVRTPQGKSGGALADVRSEELSRTVIDALLERTELSGENIDDLQWGCAQQREEQDNNLARVIALLSDLGESVPAATINRWCASSMEAIINGSNAIRLGQRDAVIAGGVESMTRVPMQGGYAYLHPQLDEAYNVGSLQMGMTAEKVARVFDISRDDQDAYALQSHERAATATDTGRFDDQLIPVETPEGILESDEGIRRETSLEKLGSLPSAFTGDGSVTAGNASQISDGAAGVVITSRTFAEEHGLTPMVEVGHNHVAGVDPTMMGIGPVPATMGLLDRTGRSIDTYDLVELNEAFASQALYCKEELEISDDIFNVNGGAIAIGHPLGASGARLPVTLVHELVRRDADRGLATLCVGFGQGAAIEFSR